MPSEYKKGEVVFKHNYDLGLKEYEKQKKQTQQTTMGGLGGVVIAWLARRFYVAKKMIS